MQDGDPGLGDPKAGSAKPLTPGLRRDRNAHPSQSNTFSGIIQESRLPCPGDLSVMPIGKA